jgi:hypothetical protein
MSALATIQYYDSVAATLGPDQTRSFVRLYLAPGMHHCYGGPGPNFFGQLDLTTVGAINTPTDLDPQSDISAVLEQWVTKGVSPGLIIATKFKNDSDPAQGVQMTRPLCPYPEIATYNGTGDTTTAANFTCKQPPSK